MNNYQKIKARLRKCAIAWQWSISDSNLSYSELAKYSEYWHKFGKRYGLLKEFRENGII